MATKLPQTPLQRELIVLVRAAMLERSIGYLKLGRMMGMSKDNLCRAIGPRQARALSVEKLFMILYALGYQCSIAIHERKLSEHEQAIIRRQGTGHDARRIAYQSLPNYATDSAESIRVAVE